MITKASEVMEKVNMLCKNLEDEYEALSITLEALHKQILQQK
jgi:hypothetical protein